MIGTATEAGRLTDQGSGYGWQAGLLNVGNSGMAGFVGGGVLGATGNPVPAGAAGGASYGLLYGVAHTDPQGSFADNGLLVLQGMAIGGMSGGMGGLAGAGMAGALSGTGLSMVTQALLTGAAAGIYGGSTARVLSGNGITPAAVTQDALLGGVSGLITYGAASVYQQATAPKPSTTSLQERANLAAQMSEAEGCEGGTSTLNDWVNKIPDLSRQAPVEIPSNATVKVQEKMGYDQITFRWTENGQNYEVRWHTKTPGAPDGQGNTWVVSQVTPGTPTGQVRTEHILVGDTWIPRYQWQVAISAYRNGTATQGQLQLLKDGHWQAP